MTALSDERTARTLLNQQLVALHRQGRAVALADNAQALQFLMALPARDEHLSRLLQEAPVNLEQLREYLQESLQELCQAEARKLVAVPVPVPPNLELTLGYSGAGTAPFADVSRDARYLAFYYSTADKPYWEDGLGGQTDSWDGYLAWAHHWRVSAGLGPYRDKLGAADAEASHTWLLDRRTRLVYVAERRDTVVRRLLHDQWPPEAWPNISPEEARELFRQRLAQQDAHPVSQAVVMQMFRQQRQEVSDLSAWLEKYWPMPVFGGGA
jgi:hypothetical protein